MRSIIVKTMIASAVLLLLGWWVEQHIGWLAVIKNFKQLDLIDVVVVFALLMLSQYLRGLRIFLAYSWIELDNPPSHKDSVAVSLLHNAANFVLPMRLGEVFLPLLSRTQLSIDLKTSGKTLLGIRLLDLYCVFFLLFMVQFLVVLKLSVVMTGLLSAAFVALPFLLSWFSKYRWLDWFCPPQFYNIRSVLLLLLFSMLIWAVKLAALFYLFNGLLAISISLQQGASAILLADLSAVLPVNGFASAGSYEFAFAIGLAGFGESGPVALDQVELLHMKAAVNLHIFLLLANFVAAFIGFFILRCRQMAPNGDQV